MWQSLFRIFQTVVCKCLKTCTCQNIHVSFRTLVVSNHWMTNNTMNIHKSIQYTHYILLCMSTYVSTLRLLLQILPSLATVPPTFNLNRAEKPWPQGTPLFKQYAWHGRYTVCIASCFLQVCCLWRVLLFGISVNMCFWGSLCFSHSFLKRPSHSRMKRHTPHPYLIQQWKPEDGEQNLLKTNINPHWSRKWNPLTSSNPEPSKAKPAGRYQTAKWIRFNKNPFDPLHQANTSSITTGTSGIYSFPKWWPTTKTSKNEDQNEMETNIPLQSKPILVPPKPIKSNLKSNLKSKRNKTPSQAEFPLTTPNVRSKGVKKSAGAMREAPANKQTTAPGLGQGAEAPTVTSKYQKSQIIKQQSWSKYKKENNRKLEKRLQ